MKRIICSLLLMVLPWLANAQTKTYKLTAQFRNIQLPAKAYLIYSYGWSDEKVLDSGLLNSGVVKFSKPLQDPVKVSLIIDRQPGNYKGWKKDQDFQTFYLEPGELLISGRDSVKTALLKGGIVNRDFSIYNTQVMSSLLRFSQSSQASFSRATPQQKADPAFMKGMMDQLKSENRKADSLKVIYIATNPKSYISITALTDLAGNHLDVTKVRGLFEKLSSTIRNTAAGKKLAMKLYDNGPVSVGKMAPEFTQNDVGGNPVRLSDFRGKYVLLDFWASWCGPCRAENPAVVSAYNTYKDKNFTVLGVSLDMPNAKAAWQQAIAKDGLSWTQVSDLKYWNNAVAKLYEVRSIPQNYLIDPKGNIVAKNLRGQALQEKLAEILD